MECRGPAPGRIGSPRPANLPHGRNFGRCSPPRGRSDGEQAAAIAIAITLQKFDERQVTSPGGYLRAMTERAAAGELHLARSVFGLAVRHGMEGIH